MFHVTLESQHVSCDLESQHVSFCCFCLLFPSKHNEHAENFTFLSVKKNPA